MLDNAFTLSRDTKIYLLCIGVCISTMGCGIAPHNPTAPRVQSELDSGVKDADRSVVVAEALHNADIFRIEQLEREAKRLKAELHRAQEILVAVESGLKSGYTRADAVKSMAEVQIKLEKTTSFSPWHPDKITHAQNKLEIAQSHIDAGRFGVGIFHIYEASNLVDIVSSENDAIQKSENLLLVSAERVNLRGGPSTSYDVITTLPRRTPLFLEERTDKWMLVRTPSGTVGWIYSGLVAMAAKGGDKD